MYHKNKLQNKIKVKKKQLWSNKMFSQFQSNSNNIQIESQTSCQIK